MTKRHDSEAALERAFAALEREAPQPDAAFLARLEAQALGVMPPPVRVAPCPRAQGGFWAQIMEALGGRVGLGGLVTSTAAGLWLGAFPPVGLDALLAPALGGSEAVLLDPLSSFDLAMLGD